MTYLWRAKLLKCVNPNDDNRISPFIGRFAFSDGQMPSSDHSHAVHFDLTSIIVISCNTLLNPPNRWNSLVIWTKSLYPVKCVRFKLESKHSNDIVVSFHLSRKKREKETRNENQFTRWQVDKWQPHRLLLTWHRFPLFHSPDTMYDVCVERPVAVDSQTFAFYIHFNCENETKTSVTVCSDSYAVPSMRTQNLMDISSVEVSELSVVSATAVYYASTPLPLPSPSIVINIWTTYQMCILYCIVLCYHKCPSSFNWRCWLHTTDQTGHFFHSASQNVHSFDPFLHEYHETNDTRCSKSS